MNEKVVIVGAGQAGVQTALSLRDEGFEGDITLVGVEPDFPYQRPPLSKAYLMGKASEADLALREADVYRKNDVRMLMGVAVVGIDRGAKTVALSPPGHLSYDYLVLATGARQRRLGLRGEDLSGVVHLRDLADAREIAARLPGVRRAVVIGAGFIGLEFAAVALAKGIEVLVVELAPRPMARALSAPMAQFFEQRHRLWGAQFAFNVSVTEIHGVDGRVDAVRLSNGMEAQADLVIVGAGVMPNVELAQNAGLEVADGIVVDAQLRTQDPAIWAAGDCARHPNPFCSAGSTRVESVQNATDQARIVARGIAGRPQAYEAVPWFWSDQGDLKLQIAGLSTGHDLAVTRGDPRLGAFSVFCFKEGRLLAVESVNRGPDHVMARRLIGMHAPVTPDQVVDEGVPLKTLLPARPEPA